jgi:hypothetical protein
MITMPRPLLLVAALVLAPSVARADDDDDSGRSWFLSMGGSFAYTFHEDASNGGSLGLEVSLGQFWFPKDDKDDGDTSWNFRLDPYWAGVYVDLLHDTSLEKTRISIGPELGYYLFGVDGGLLVETGDDDRVGMSLRPALTFAVATLWVRYGRFFDDKPDDELWEMGLLVKYPLPL